VMDADGGNVKFGEIGNAIQFGTRFEQPELRGTTR